jgi:hypothetical protein
MGLFEKNGGWTSADDVADYCENWRILFDLCYSEAVVQWLQQVIYLLKDSLQEGGKAKWLGCSDHLLQLLTKSLLDLPMSEGALKASRNLVIF